jgi:hypothetical protein
MGKIQGTRFELILLLSLSAGGAFLRLSHNFLEGPRPKISARMALGG